MSARSIPSRAAAITPSDSQYITDTVRVNETGTQTAESVDIEESIITLESHGLNDGDAIMLTDAGTVTDISVGEFYYVADSTTDTFKLTTTIGGTAVVFDGDDTTPPSWMRSSKLVTATVTGCVYVGGAGDVVALPVDHDDTDDATPAPNGAVVFKAVPAGSYIPVEVKKVFSTGTTATNILCVYYQP